MEATSKTPNEGSSQGEHPEATGSGGFLRRNGKRILWLLLAWAVLTGGLIWLSAGPQNEPFVYQVF